MTRLMLAGLLACAAVCGGTSGALAARSHSATAQHHPTPPFEVARMVNSEVGWGVESNAILRTTDGGAKWVNVTPPHFRPAFGFDGLTAVSAKAAWISYNEFCGKAYCQPIGGVLRTTEGGARWHIIPLGSPTLAPSKLPGLKSLLDSLSPRHIEHALIEGSSQDSGSFRLLTANQVDRIAGWLRSAPVTTHVKPCTAANPMSYGSTLYLDIRGIGANIANMTTCTVTKGKYITIGFALSETYVRIGGYRDLSAYLASPRLAGFLIHEWSYAKS